MSIQPTNNNNLISFTYSTQTKTRVGTSTDSDTSEAQDNTMSTSTSSVSDSNSLSLTSLDEQLKTADDIDWDKVSQVKDALSQGTLSIDLDALSQAIVEMHSA